MAMRMAALLLLLLARPAAALTGYDNLADWQAAVGAYQVDDLESYPEMRLPLRGGSIELDHFSIENDDQGDNDWSGDSGLYLGHNWYSYPEIPDTMNLIVSTESGSPPYGGPHYIDAVFATPIRAYALDYSWCEDYEPDECTFRGVVLDEPVTRFHLAGSGDLSDDYLFLCHHSWCAIDSVLWAPVPEPSTGLLVALGLAGLRRRERRHR
jgi:hypothetical protein